MSLSAVITGAQEGRFIEIKKLALPQISDDQILIRSVAFAINPTDIKHIQYGMAKTGAIAGSDVSGIVEEVGKNVKGFAKGDHVSTFMRGSVSTERGAFAQYVIGEPGNTLKYQSLKDSQLPAGAHSHGPIDTFEAAASVTLGLVCLGVSFSHSLAINEKDAAKKAILIWGGASSTGVLAIQIAKKMYGLQVITTASAKHHDFLRSLGADAVFDYHDQNVVENIRKHAAGSIAYGLDIISIPETLQMVYDASSGSEKVVIDNLLALDLSAITTDPSRDAAIVRTLGYSSLGEDLQFGPVLFKSGPAMREAFGHFWSRLPEFLPTLVTNNLRVLAPGLETANDALQWMKEERASGEKTVWRY